MGTQKLGPRGRGRRLWAWEIGPPGIAIEEKRDGLKQSLRSFGQKGVLGYGAHKGVLLASEAVT